MNYIFSAIIPILICLIIIYGVSKKLPVFNIFVDGAKEGIETSFNLIPTLICIIFAISMLRASGFFQLISSALYPVTSFLHIPSEVIPLALMRPFSGSGSIAVVNDIITSCGADSIAAVTACVMCGSTETTFYAIAVYYGSVDIKKTRHTVLSAVIGDIAAVIGAIFFSQLFFKL